MRRVNGRTENNSTKSQWLSHQHLQCRDTTPKSSGYVCGLKDTAKSSANDFCRSSVVKGGLLAMSELSVPNATAFALCKDACCCTCRDTSRTPTDPRVVRKEGSPRSE